MKEELRDLTKGPLAKQILLFSLPLMLSNFLQVLFNMADIAVVGRFVGEAAMGAVGSTANLVTLFTWVLIGLSAGVNVRTALHFGAGNREKLSGTVHSALLLCLGAGLLLLWVGTMGASWILGLMKTKPELMDGAVRYLRIFALGMPALAVYNCGSAIFSAVGETRRPLCYLTLSGVVNVLLNLLLVVVCGMEVEGVAIASVIAQYLSAILVTQALFRCPEAYRYRWRALRLDGVQVQGLLAVGIPAAFQNAIFALANLFIQMGVNSFDAVMVEGNAAAATADGLVFDVMEAFYIACGSFIGQNFGARNRERIRKSYLISLGYSFGAGLILGVGLLLLGPQFLGLFTDDPAVVEMGMKRLTIMSLSYGVSAFMDCTIAASRGLGKSLVPTIMVMVGGCLFRIAWIYTVFAWFQTIPSLYLLYLCSWVLTALPEIWYFRRAFRRETADFPPMPASSEGSSERSA